MARGSGMSATFSRAGVIASGARDTSLRLGLEAIGRGRSLRQIKNVSPTGRSNVVNYERSGIDESYTNNPLGLEQSFTVDRRAAGNGDLTLVVGRLPAADHATVASGGSSLSVAGTRGVTGSWNYADLVVTDASGRRVPARIEVSDGRITLKIDDVHATYPLRIDPMLGFDSSVGLTEATDLGYDQFGDAVAASANGDTIVVGAPASVSSQGAVYVFTEPQSGVWQNATETAELTAADGANSDRFGASVSVSGDGSTIVVGAPGHASGQGAVYVFDEPQGGWAQDATQTEVTASDGAAGDALGGTVSISEDGSTVVAGAPDHEVNTNAGQGAVYVFNRPQVGGWQDATQTELTATDGAAGDEFGTDAAISGDSETVVAGAPGHEVNTNPHQGAAYVFSKPEHGSWQDATYAQLVASNGSASDSFGYFVALSDDGSTIVADGPGTESVFTKPAVGGWSNTDQSADLTTEGLYPGTDEYWPAAISGDGATLAVGVPPVVSQASVGAGLFYDKPTTGGWQNDTETGALGRPNQDFASTNEYTPAIAISQDSSTVVVGGTGGPVLVFPAVPEATSQPGILGTRVQGETLTDAHAAWSGNPSQYTYRWYECDSTGVTCSFIPGALDQTYTLQSSDVGHTIMVQEAGISSFGYGDPVNSVAYPVLALSATAHPGITGEPLQGNTLTETNATWNANVNSLSYQWERCDVSGTNCSPIAGATGHTYTLTNVDAGDTIVVRETASNAGGSGLPSYSAPSASVIPLPPVSTSAPTISGTVVQGNTLTAISGVWSNAPTSFSYQWEDCNVTGQACLPIAGATSPTYSLGASDIAERVIVDESAANAGGSSTLTPSGATAAVPEFGPVGLEINGGAYATDNPSVTIGTAWPAGTQSILISNNGGFRTDVETVSPAETITWKLEQTGTDRLPKTVYVRFLGAGQDDINFTDDIILDETPPTIQSATIGGAGAARASAGRAPKLKSYRLHLLAKDPVVGVCRAATSQRRSSAGEVVTLLTSCNARGILELSRILKLKLRARPHYVRVQNSAGDWSHWMAIK